MQASFQFMTLKDILERHGILAASELRRRVPELSRQQAHNLWRAKAGVGRKTMALLHERLGIPLEELMEVDPVPHSARYRRRPPNPPPEEGPS